MATTIEQVQTDLVRAEGLLRSDIHTVDTKVDTLTNRLNTHAEATRQQLSALESNLATLAAKQEAGFATLLELIAAVRSEAQASEVRLLAAIQSLH